MAQLVFPSKLPGAIAVALFFCCCGQGLPISITATVTAAVLLFPGIYFFCIASVSVIVAILGISFVLPLSFGLQNACND